MNLGKLRIIVTPLKENPEWLESPYCGGALPRLWTAIKRPDTDTSSTGHENWQNHKNRTG